MEGTVDFVSLARAWAGEKGERMARDINGQWTITQSNGFEVLFDIVQAGDGSLHGSGTVIGGREANASGRLTGDDFSYTVDWNANGRGGVYSGRFDPNGILTGITFDLENPSSQATWFAHTFEAT